MTTDELTGLMYLIAYLFIYMLPAFIAYQRSHYQTAAIAILNFLLGWTLLGWVIALVWASTQVRKDQ
mgnify:CR=1 FL=1